MSEWKSPATEAQKQEIALLEEKVNAARKQLQDLSHKLRQARIDACGVKPGDIVIYKGVEHSVADISFVSWGKPWLVGRKRTKDGSFGTLARSLYGDWSLPHAD